MKNLSHTALILIDIQKAFLDLEYWGNRNNPQAEENCHLILEHWRKHEAPLFHIQHCSENPVSLFYKDNPGFQHMELVKPLPNETVIAKFVNSAFIGTDLQERLEEMRIQEVVIVGLTTDHCVSTTCRMAANLGFKTQLISDATATVDKEGTDGKIIPAETVHQVHLASLKDEFAQILTTEELFNSLNEGIPSL